MLVGSSLVSLLVGCGGVSNSKDAPFEIGRLVGQLFTVDPDVESRSREAVLVLSDEELGCAKLTDNLYSSLDAAVGDGKGLLFLLEHDSNQEGAGLEWSGLWMSGYGYSESDGTERSLRAMSFADGFVYIDYGSYYGFGETTWLQIDTATDTEIAGDFNTTNWEGSFSAEYCGAWTVPPRDTRDTDYWDSW
jgi:hypothetical protein